MFFVVFFFNSELTADSADDVLMLKQEVSKVSKKLNSVNTKLESFREQTAIRLNKVRLYKSTVRCVKHQG